MTRTIEWNNITIHVTKLDNNQFLLSARFKHEDMETIFELDNGEFWNHIEDKDVARKLYAILHYAYMLRFPTRQPYYNSRDTHIITIRELLTKAINYHWNKPYRHTHRNQLMEITTTKAHQRQTITIYERNNTENIILEFSFNKNTQKLIFQTYVSDFERNEVVKFYQQRYPNIQVTDRQLIKHKKTILNMLKDPYCRRFKYDEIMNAVKIIDNNINSLYL